MYRIRIILLTFLAVGLLIFVRLFSLQVVEADQLQSLAKSQHQTRARIPASRGSILASDGFPLAATSESWLVWASLPKLEERPEDIAEKLAPILESTEAATLAERLNKEDVVWVPLKHKITRQQKDEIEKLSIPGIGFDPEEARSYPEATMAAHLLGFVGKDAAGQDQGYFGLEGYYDLTLSGTSGERSLEKDALGLPILVGGLREVRPLDGLSLQTHIDRSIQFLVERHLEEGLEKYGASEGLVVVMRPQDGAVLAMAALPAYDPGRFTSFPKESYVNPVVGSSFEPGSVFKPLVMSAALDAGVVKPDTNCEECSGPRRIGKFTIRTWNDEYFPDSTMTEVIQHSDNVGMIWTAEQLGKDRLYDYLVRFGLGRATGIDLQDEAAVALRPKNEWGVIDLAVGSFGQGIAVTPIQMLRAVAAIANGGELFIPQVVDRIVGSGYEQDIKPLSEGRVISKKADRQMTEMLVNAVDNGEAKWAKPKGFKIAGKTGTAQIPVAGHYDPEKTIASFVGFALADPPAGGPQFVMMVSLREPTSSPFGSETAAPLWFSIARDLFPYLGIQPQ